MINTLQVCNRSIQVDAPRIITLVAATATLVFPSEKGLKRQFGGGQVYSRYVQNTGSENVYLSFGISGPPNANNIPTPVCDNAANYHALIFPGQLFDCAPHIDIVCAYSVNGSTLSTVRMTVYPSAH